MKGGTGLQVDNAVNEGGIKGHAEADRCHDNLKGSDEIFLRQGSERHVPFLVLRVKRPISCLVSKLTRFVDEQYTWIGFVQNEHVNEEDNDHHHSSHLKWNISAINGAWFRRISPIRTYSVHLQLTPDTSMAPATTGDNNGPPATAIE